MKTRSVLFAIAIPVGGLLTWGGLEAREQYRQHRWLHQSYAPAPEGMVFVPPGSFLMGSDEERAEPDERPQRSVFLPGFYIDRLEITNRDYLAYKPDHVFPTNEANLPVTGVLKVDAEACCQSLGKRLPTSAEWEKAARGTNGLRFPWGNEFNPSYANVKTHTTLGLHPVLPATEGMATNEATCTTGKVPVGSFPSGASPYGCLDMSGNVWEWVADPWVDRNWLGLPEDTRRGILRGGAYGYSPFQARTSYQGFEGLLTTCNDVGFRCAQDARTQD